MPYLSVELGFGLFEGVFVGEDYVYGEGLTFVHGVFRSRNYSFEMLNVIINNLYIYYTRVIFQIMSTFDNFIDFSFNSMLKKIFAHFLSSSAC